MPVNPLLRARGIRVSAVAVSALLMIILALPAAPARARFELGFDDNAFFRADSTSLAFNTFNAVRGRWIRILLRWSLVAPAGNRKPTGFDARNPSDPHYSWAAYDAAVRLAAQRHANLILDVTNAPAWAEGPDHPNDPTVFGGAWDPDPSAYADFLHAAALRYGGQFTDPANPTVHLPRVRDWEIWNEENLPGGLAAPHLEAEYRALLNRAYGEIKAVNRGDVVAFGGLAPVSYLTRSISPLKFAADLMCLRRVKTSFRPIRRCRAHVKFDVFAAHPYTLAATPTKHAYHYNDVLIGDMAKYKALLRAARRFNTVKKHLRTDIWNTEWGWFTNPPNRIVGDSARTAARYVAYSMYEMWENGVSVVCWFPIEDPTLPPNQPQQSTSFTVGSGLYTSTGHRKLMYRAYDFPVIASVRRGHGLVWGRAPVSVRTRVAVQRLGRVGGHKRWKQIGTVRTGSDGVFRLHFKATRNGSYRAHVVHGPTSLAYYSAPIPPKRTHAFYSG